MSNKELELAQNYALYTHRNIFLTGKAGTGKTTFLKNLQEMSPKRMVVVAPTGVAAINAGGVTIHSFFQLAPGLFLPNGKMVGTDTHTKYSYSKHKINLLRSVNLLVIDEISMVRADLLDAIDGVLRRYQHRDQPFGGVQLLLIGDLQQLAPVATESEWNVLRECYDTPYFFSSHALNQTNFVCIELKHVYRQQDQDFITLLNAVRDNQLTPSLLEKLNSRFMPKFVPPDGEHWITLTTHNAQANKINTTKLDAIDLPATTFHATVKGDFPELSFPTDEHLTLKVGAQVMFCKNDPSPEKLFYNGLIGRITDITNDSVTVQCPERTITTKALDWVNSRYVTDSETGTISEEVIGNFTQIPLRLAWAITIHKSQGLTFDRAIINAGYAFSHGQVYVALSRCRTLEGLVLSTPISASLILSDPEVVRFGHYADEHVPTPQTFITDRRAFISDILCEIFDFKSISMRLRYLLRLANEHLYKTFPMYVQQLEVSAQQTDAELMSIGIKFQQYIRANMGAVDALTDNPAFHEKLCSGMKYYASKTASIIGDIVQDGLPEIDNSRVKEQMSREMELLVTDYNEKINIFTACLNAFSLEAYWNAKAKASMTEETHTTKRKSTKSSKPSKAAKPAKPTGKYLPSPNLQGLYDHLIAWRKSVAEERKVPPHYILPLTTLISLLQVLPRNYDELMTVYGIGPKLANDYGSDLLTIISEFHQ